MTYNEVIATLDTLASQIGALKAAVMQDQKSGLVMAQRAVFDEELDYTLTYLAAALGLPRDRLLGPSKEQPLALKRQCICWFARTKLSVGLAATGRAMGDRNHGTVHHAVTKIEAIRHIDEEVQGYLRQLQEAYDYLQKEKAKKAA